MRTAVALPVRIDIKDCYDATCTELTVTANIGGRAGVHVPLAAGSVAERRRQACLVLAPHSVALLCLACV